MKLHARGRWKRPFASYVTAIAASFPAVFLPRTRLPRSVGTAFPCPIFFLTLVDVVASDHTCHYPGSASPCRSGSGWHEKKEKIEGLYDADNAENDTHSCTCVDRSFFAGAHSLQWTCGPFSSISSAS
ncbi:uncharacterized protein BKA78DRAFT_301434 [Phyllosticta capitalensis]|uniref:uncharacterized protein n=1 Tax=Phyllosticta capitalensis TaxID=121624 RepID=UPI0031319986